MNLLGLIITILVNYLSNTGFINGNRMKTISDLYDNYFTPASYAFSIWGLIYIFLIAFVIYTFKTLRTYSNLINKVNPWFLMSCVLNCAWIFAWVNDYSGLSVLIMICLLVVVIKILLNLEGEATSFPAKVFVHWPFSLYAGWLSVALIANMAAFLTKIEWDDLGISEVNWTIIMLLVAGLLNIVMIWKKSKIVYALVGCWGLFAVAVSNKDQNDTIYLVGCATAFFILVNCVLSTISIFRIGNKTL